MPALAFLVVRHSIYVVLFPKSVIRFRPRLLLVSCRLQRKCWRHSGLWRNTYGSKMPKETVTRGEKMENISFLYWFRSNDRFGFIVNLSAYTTWGCGWSKTCCCPQRAKLLSKKAVTFYATALFSMWTSQGLNLGPPDYESVALTNWATSPRNRRLIRGCKSTKIILNAQDYRPIFVYLRTFCESKDKHFFCHLFFLHYLCIR